MNMLNPVKTGREHDIFIFAQHLPQKFLKMTNANKVKFSFRLMGKS